MLKCPQFTSFSKLRDSLLSVPVCLPISKKETEFESNISKIFRIAYVLKLTGVGFKASFDGAFAKV